MTHNKTGLRNISLILFLFIFSLALITEVKAQTPVYDNVYKQYSDINLISNCFNNGTSCSKNTICNSTVIDPNGIVLINNSLEENHISYYNITLNNGKSITPGLFTQVNVCYDPSGDIKGNGRETKYFLVTPSGTDANSLSNLILISVGFLLSAGTIMFGFSKSEPWVVILGSFVLVLLGIHSLINGVGNYRNDLTQWSSSIIMAIGGYISIRSGLEVMDVI